MLQSDKIISIGARDSKLSIAQVEEVLQELKVFHPQIAFDPIYVKTIGDIDQKTSLRTLEKTDFFTREIDLMLLEGRCRIAIHSAKDLPDPLPIGLALAAVTKGVDSSDALVLREKMSLETLPKKSKVAASSLRREKTVHQLREDLCFVDIRGTIEKRLEKLFNGEVDGLVVAEAALIRLKLTHLNRVLLDHETAPLQGKLAIVTKDGDEEMKKLFWPLHSQCK